MQIALLHKQPAAVASLAVGHSLTPLLHNKYIECTDRICILHILGEICPLVSCEFGFIPLDQCRRLVVAGVFVLFSSFVVITGGFDVAVDCFENIQWC